jgi:hypothetical protein
VGKPATDNLLTLSADSLVVKMRGGCEKLAAPNRRMPNTEPQHFEGKEQRSVREKGAYFADGHSLVDILRLFRFSR